MNGRSWSFTVGLLSVAVAAQAQVKTFSIRADGVLCLSCAHRVEKAIQRVAGVQKVQVHMQPVYAEVTPRAGAWLEPDRLRDAIKNAGFKPGEVRCTVTGQLTEWHGQPALSLAGSERPLVLQAASDAPQAMEQARRLLGEGKKAEVEVEGQLAGRAVAGDRASPLVLRASRMAAAR
jgi:copper chaperone CopZ